MTTCTPSCPCRCGQMGCGCRPAPKSAALPLAPFHACSMCERAMRTSEVTSPSGAVITVTLCRHCDVRTCPEPQGGCGHREQDPTATKCSSCGRYF